MVAAARVAIREQVFESFRSPRRMQFSRCLIITLPRKRSFRSHKGRPIGGKQTDIMFSRRAQPRGALTKSRYENTDVTH